ncbi:hypothetical protein CSB45_10885 [candidate division KSB3 bacterium]|uniref:Transcription factor zinc-finger domain-containing protein n=1 Tax=candidate division KSB3 bacterium TaxID=2044937 RepID=A0A2G6E371_9BACT|nr:MAG: hypothetical protein CSB45_10885 [candidate division KSB3 bacterium]PIE29084.1 MAG: hypothetical protein CSA57_10720 [candidate division KSB3 bacterium]
MYTVILGIMQAEASAPVHIELKYVVSNINLWRMQVNNCPNCHQSLAQFDYQDLELSYCADCRGFWFKECQFREVKHIGFTKLPGAEEYAETHEDSGEPSSETIYEAELACPDCDQNVLMPYTYAYSSNIQLYRCAGCHGIWAELMALLRIEDLLHHYQESLEEAKSKALPLMMRVKNQIQQEELKQEKRQKKQRGVFNRLFASRTTNSPENKKFQDIFGDHDDRTV